MAPLLLDAVFVTTNLCQVGKEGMQILIFIPLCISTVCRFISEVASFIPFHDAMCYITLSQVLSRIRIDAFTSLFYTDEEEKHK